ncbi:Hint domain-containing protein [Sulfitobacter sp. 20_GPM-1509m]|uniref:Hint domain-containing protein n=1 Tax=Sulfitobacter sp. 20_GPM-1509m TaxID=1380367 RepID=UPI000685BEF5|nr:Hint domain-containing protein [Sulfitobacter sp. 20_GPM-1509m]
MTLNFKLCTFSPLPGHAKWHWFHWWKPWHPPHWGGGKDDCDPVPCFTPGTRVYTPAGSIAVEDVRPGDHLLTRDSGMQQVVWVGRRTLSAAEIAADPALAPIRIARGSLGDDLPCRDMLVSPQHRFLVRGPGLAVEFSEPEMLVPATGLRTRQGVSQIAPDTGVSYIHLLFKRHEIVLSDGLWTESFQPAARMVDGMERRVQTELHSLFPCLRAPDRDRSAQTAFASARPTLKPREMLAAFEIG